MTTEFVAPIPSAKGRGRGGSTAFLGKFVVRYLEENGSSSPSDIHRKLSEMLSAAATAKGNPWKPPTWKSFWVWFKMASKLGLIEKLGTEPTERRPNTPPFIDGKTIWDLTELGRTSPDLWQNVRKNLYPVTPEKQRQYGLQARAEKKRRKRVAELASVGQVEVDFTEGEPAFRRIEG